MPSVHRHVPGRDALLNTANERTILSMEESCIVTCPYCGEDVEIYVESDVRGGYVQDCEVCCHPWEVYVTGSGESRTVDVRRGDGSE